MNGHWSMSLWPISVCQLVNRTAGIQGKISPYPRPPALKPQSTNNTNPWWFLRACLVWKHSRDVRDDSAVLQMKSTKQRARLPVYTSTDWYWICQSA